jgi:hypothetical protein
MLGLSVFQGISAQTPVKEDYSVLDTYLNKSVGPQDVVAVSVPFTIYPIEYQYQGSAKIVTIPEWDHYDVGSIPKFEMNTFINQINDLKKNYNQIDLVLSYDQGYQKDIVNYMDTHYALVQKKDFSESVELRVYKLRY